ncbi:MAG TPA: S53 family peptidase [Ktedonobacteraceae bacterium]|nr:S53 family peptidase [Ktedonobacteraceae bacterium]
MRGYIFSRRFLVLALTCSALLATLAGVLYVRSGISQAAYTAANHSVSAHPHYSYAGLPDGQHFQCQSPTALVHCYGPAQIRNAYSIQPVLDSGINGQGSTIVILDAFQAPHIEEDLKRFDRTFGLSNPKLNILTPDGLTPFDPTDPRQVNWSAEISLDVEWAHVVAPAATIDLVLAKSDQDADLGRVLHYAVTKNLGDVISMSFGENEACLDPAVGKQWHQDFLRATRAGMTLFSSSGDTGDAQSTCDNSANVKAVSQPAVDSLVTAVGGTQLVADTATGSYTHETTWNEPAFQLATGGGFSTMIGKPAFQYHMPGIGAYRAVSDVAYDAAIDGGVLAVWSDGPRGPRSFYIFGGTSAGSPQWAGIVALAVQLDHHRLGFLNPLLYAIGHSPKYGQAFNDITSGNNTITLSNSDGSSVTIPGYDAKVGWDPVTGWGSPRVSKLLPMLLATQKK